MIDSKPKRRIILPYGASTRIAEAMGVARSTVWMALRATIQSEKSATIRELALSEYGGVYAR